MAQFWRPIALAGVVAALVFSAAVRGGGDEATDVALVVAPESDASSTLVGTSGKAFVSVSSGGPRPAPGDIAAPPVPEVDGIGTRRLTGYVRMNVALTFDDGPHPQQTPAVLAILREYDITATFCLVGNQVRTYPDLVRAIADDGHVLCNHTLTHDTKLPGKDDSAIADELTQTHEAIVAAVPDADIRFFRAPGGSFAENVNAVAEAQGLTPLGWSIDTEDWRKPGADAIRDSVTGGIHPGAVVLLHDGGGDRAGSVAALPEIIGLLRDGGYRFVVPSQ